MTTIPYFYIIEHVSTARRYAGIRTAKGCCPSELLKIDGYHTSSTRVRRIIKKEGVEAFKIVQITEMEDPLDYETRFLKENNCVKSSMWLNLHDNNGISASFGSTAFKENMTEKYGVENIMKLSDQKERASKAAKEWATANPEKVKEHGQKVRQWALDNPEKAKLRAEKVAIAKKENGTTGKGTKRPHYTNNGKTGKFTRSEYTCKKISDSQKTNSLFVKNNPMNDPEKRKLVSLSKKGLKRVYRDDGTFYMSRDAI